MSNQPLDFVVEYTPSLVYSPYKFTITPLSNRAMEKFKHEIRLTNILQVTSICQKLEKEGYEVYRADEALCYEKPEKNEVTDG